MLYILFIISYACRRICYCCSQAAKKFAAYPSGICQAEIIIACGAAVFLVALASTITHPTLVVITKIYSKQNILLNKIRALSALHTDLLLPHNIKYISSGFTIYYNPEINKKDICWRFSKNKASRGVNGSWTVF